MPGVVQPNYKLSRGGGEETLQVNVMLTILLSMLLLPGMRASALAATKEDGDIGAAPHLCFVSSGHTA